MLNTAVSFAIRLLTGASVRWLGCQPTAGPRIYFANHSSNLDAVVVWSALPSALRRCTRPVAARDYWTANALRRHLAADVFRVVLIERHHVTAHNNPLGALTESLDAGESLILFPEGRRNPGPDTGEFKSGLYHLGTLRPAVELVPVHIDNMNRILPKGELLPVPLISRISFGPPLHVADGESKIVFLERARNAVETLGSNP